MFGFEAPRDEDSSDTDSEDMDMFEIHISDTDVTSGSIPISWCITKEAIEWLESIYSVEPCVVISISPGGENYHKSKERRVIVPLKQLLAYVQFNCSGENVIRAFIHPSLSTARSYFLPKMDRSYCTDIISYDGKSYSIFMDDYRVRKAKSVTVNVPKECFAKEPPEWEKEWVNLFYKNKVVDQCEYRKRRIYAYSIQIFLMSLSMLFRCLSTFIVLLYGSRSFSIKYLLHPLTYDLGDTVFDLFIGRNEESTGTIFKLKTKYKWLNYIPIVLMPLISIPLAILFTIYPAALVIMAKVSALILMTALFFFAAIFTVAFVTSKLKKRRKVKDKKDKIKVEPPLFSEEDKKFLICDGTTKITKISDLPKSRRTIYLRFHDFKNKVCKPFSL